jgi:DNA-directed RNA polymerase specialized sigma24 family protein
VTGKNRIAAQLQAVARRLSSRPEVQWDVAQEMFVHLVQLQTKRPNQDLSWYLTRCKAQALHRLKSTRNSSAPAPAEQSARLTTPPAQPRPFISPEEFDRLLPHLSNRQQQVGVLLARGFGIRETARELGISHPAVIKHRNRILHIAREFFPDTEGVGVAVAIHNSTDGKGDPPAA